MGTNESIISNLQHRSSGYSCPIILIGDKTAAVSNYISCITDSAGTRKTNSIKTYFNLMELKSDILSVADADFK
jgi:hypothetical protein